MKARPTPDFRPEQAGQLKFEADAEEQQRDAYVRYGWQVGTCLDLKRVKENSCQR